MSAANDSCVFNPTVLSDLLGDDSINDFLANYSQLLDEKKLPLSTAIRQNNRKLVRQLSHQLISTSLSVGALELGEICRTVELACDDDGLIFSANEADHLSDAFDRAQHAVSELINGY